MSKPKILLIDIETAPLLNYCWGIWDQNVGLNQIKNDWFILSFAAKWHDPEGKIKYPIIYADNRNSKDIENDKPLLDKVWKLLDEADIILSQNGKKFDIKKLNARFVMNGMSPPSSYRHIDTLQLAKKHFAFTSNKLEYMSEKLGCKHKKLKHKNFPGFELWKECLAGNKKAWKEMEAYNKYDVLALEEVYKKLIPWDNSINFNVYNEDENTLCRCGGELKPYKGYTYTESGKFARYRCIKCGTGVRSKVNLLSKEKRASLVK